MSKSKKALAPKIPDYRKVDTYIQYCCLVILFLIPLAVKLKVLNFISPKISINILSTGIQGSYFSYVKWLILIIFTLIILSLFMIKLIKYEYSIKPSYINLPAAVMVAIILLSTLLAKYKMIALVGMYNQHEGAITYICCILLMVIAANTAFTGEFGRKMLWTLGLLSVCLSIFSVSSFLGYNLMESSTLRTLITGKQYAAYSHGVISSTLGNPNYSSGLGAALVCLFLICFIWGIENIPRKYTFVFMLTSMLLVWSSQSLSGMAVMLAGLVGIVLFACYDLGVKGSLKNNGIVLLSILVSFLILNLGNPQLSQELFSWKGSPSAVPQQKESLMGKAAEAKIPQTATTGLSAGSGRSYIWEKTVKLVEAKPLLGYGADTLVFYFPQHDPDKKANLGSYSTYVDKPHNAYLGFAYNFGVLAALVLLYLFLAHLFLNLRLILRTTGEMQAERIYILAMLAFLTAFWLQGLVNDFVIGSLPLLWLLMGFSVSLYNLLEQK